MSPFILYQVYRPEYCEWILTIEIIPTILKDSAVIYCIRWYIARTE